jgi:outer membrane protein assembly factor BamB
MRRGERPRPLGQHQLFTPIIVDSGGTHLKNGCMRALWIAGLLALVTTHVPAPAGRVLDVEMVEMIVPTGEAEKYWPRWRGPSGQGLVPGSGYPDRWSDNENVRWRVEVPGEGHSSPIIWGDKLLLTTSYDQGERRSILCFSRNDGELLWETFVPYQTDDQSIHRSNTYASSTPATDGERVYAYFGNYGLIAVDFDGKVVWHDPIGDFTDVLHGPAGSPVLYGDKVILYQENGDPTGASGSFVAAWDRESGERAWWTPRQEHVGWGSPIVIRTPDRDELIVSSQAAVRAYEPDTGELLWSARGSATEVVPTPVVGRGLIFAPSGSWSPHKPTLAIRPGGAGDVTGTHVVWQIDRHSPFLSSPVFYDGLLYTIDDQSGHLSVFRPETGELVYREEFEEDFVARTAVVNIPGSMIAMDGKIFVTAEDGRTWVFRAGAEYELLHVNQLPGPIFASPALVDGKWYWRTTSELICLGAAGAE